MDTAFVRKFSLVIVATRTGVGIVIVKAAEGRPPRRLRLLWALITIIGNGLPRSLLSTNQALV